MFAKKLMVAMALLAGASEAMSAGSVVIQASGKDPAAIQAAVDGFRFALGVLNLPNLAPPAAGVGRREINWDGVPDALASPNPLPFNFFNTTSKRGVEFVSIGSAGFHVSANAGIAPVEFSDIRTSYTTDFQTFSAQRLFTPIDSNVMEVLFFVPLSNPSQRAWVNAFGAVFTDVDGPNTTIEYINTRDVVVHKAVVPPSVSGGLSFVGVKFDTDKIAKVRITTGNANLNAWNRDLGALVDLVVMDDFIYGEPQQ